VAGLINWETTLAIESFPLAYNPVNYAFGGVNGGASGVGYNIAKALHTLGHQVDFLSLLGEDPLGQLCSGQLAALGIPTGHILPQLPQTPQSCILYEKSGRRQIHVDLKNIQEASYPPDLAAAALQTCDLAVLCNINFSRPLLELALRLGRPIATDVHALADLDDPYNRDYMSYAQILFMSHESLPASPWDFARQVMARYAPQILVIGLGGEGALLMLKGEGEPQHFPARPVRPIVSTVGAGDALFSAFLHGHLSGQSPAEALRAATVFAGYKIGERGAAEGFLSAEGLRDWVNR
jgi:ribokinase